MHIFNNKFNICRVISTRDRKSNEITITNVLKRIAEYGLKIVIPVLLDNSTERIAENSADVVYALDMFHRFNEPDGFLYNIHM